MLRAALLDVDGTLIDTNDAHARAWKTALDEAGYGAGYLEIRWRIGMGGDRLVPELTGLNDNDPAQRKKADALRDRHKELFLGTYLPDCNPVPGARELLQRLKSRGLLLIVATSAAGDELNRILKQAGVQDLIDARTSNDDADSSKPAPDIVNAALAKKNLRPEEAVMIGDTPYDILAAHRAGVRIIALTCGGWDEHDLEEADAIYRDPADLMSHLDQSPFAEQAAEQRPGL